MSSQKIVDLRKRQTGGHMRLPLSFGGSLGSGRKSPLRARRRRVRTALAFGALLLLAGAAYGVSWLSYHPKFSINEISIAGTKDISARLVHAYAEAALFDGAYPPISRTNIFFFPAAEVEQALAAAIPQISSAKISRASLFAQAATILIEERAAYARWCLSAQAGDDGNSCYLMDREGFLFSALATSSQIATEYIFTGDTPEGSPVGHSYLAGHLPGVRALLEELGQAGYAPQKVEAEDGQDFSVFLTEGFVVRASFGQSPETLVRNLELVLASAPLRGKEHELEYVDLRFGNRVYYKLKGEDQRSAD